MLAQKVLGLLGASLTTLLWIILVLPTLTEGFDPSSVNLKRRPEVSTAPAPTAAGTGTAGNGPRCSEDARLPNLPRPAPAVLSLTLPVGERSRLENGRVSWREARRALRRVVTVPAPPPHARCRHRAGSCRPGHGPGPGRAAGGAPGACGNLSHGHVQSGRLRGRSERKNNSSGISPCGGRAGGGETIATPAPRPRRRPALLGRCGRAPPPLGPSPAQGTGGVPGGAQPRPLPSRPAPAGISLIFGFPRGPVPKLLPTAAFRAALPAAARGAGLGPSSDCCLPPFRAGSLWHFGELFAPPAALRWPRRAPRPPHRPLRPHEPLRGLGALARPGISARPGPELARPG